MSIQTMPFYTNGSFSLPLNLLSATITVTAYGGVGGAPSGYSGNAGASVTGSLLASLLQDGGTFDVVIGRNGEFGNGGFGYSGGGAGGGWLYGLKAPFFGGGGGGSTAVISSTGALYIEAGGGDGHTYIFGYTTGAPSTYPGGSGGGYASNTPDNATNVGLGAGSGGSQGGNGGGAVSWAPGDGHGGVSPTNGNPAAGLESGQGVGSGGDIQIGCGASFADSSNVSGVTYAENSTLFGSVAFSYHIADAPSAPVLVSPIGYAYTDSDEAGVTFAGLYSAPSADTGALASICLAIQVGTGTVYYWDGTDFSSTSPVWVVPTTGQGASNNEEFTVVVPPGILADNQTYHWNVAASESSYGLQGPFATPAYFISVSPPTVVIDAPVGDVNSLTPPVSWTPTIPYSGTQLNYRFVIYSQAQEMPVNSITPPASSDLIYDSGLVSTPPSDQITSFTIPAGLLHSINNYYGYLQIQSSVGAIPSLWTPAPFTVELIGTDVVTLAGLPENDPTTGLPASALTMTINATDLNQAWFQADYVGDGSWVDCICGIQIITDQTCTVYDLGAPYNVPLMYRVRGAGSIGGEQYVTAWSNILRISDLPSLFWTAVAPTLSSGSLSLYRLPSSGASLTDEAASPTTPAMPNGMTASFIEDEWEQLGTFHSFGKSTATVVHGDLWNSQFTLDLFFISSAQWNAFRAIRNLQQVVLLKSDMEGAVYWVTIGPDLNPGIMSEVDRQSDPKRGLTIQCTPTDPYTPPNPFVPTN